MTETLQQALRTATDPATWVDRHGDSLYRFALSRVRDPAVAEEVVQETFVSALQARGRFSGQSSERTWLVGILKHKIIDHFRRQRREQPVEDVEALTDELDALFDASGHWKMHEGAGPIEWGTDAETLLAQQEFLEVLERCLMKLPQRLAQAFSLRELEELTTKEICQALQISPTNLWVILHRARRQLRQCLEVNWFAHGPSRDSVSD